VDEEKTGFLPCAALISGVLPEYIQCDEYSHKLVFVMPKMGMNCGATKWRTGNLLYTLDILFCSLSYAIMI
jgi:hypothetical protein